MSAYITMLVLDFGDFGLAKCWKYTQSSPDQVEKLSMIFEQSFQKLNIPSIPSCHYHIDDLKEFSFQIKPNLIQLSLVTLHSSILQQELKFLGLIRYRKNIKYISTCKTSWSLQDHSFLINQSNPHQRRQQHVTKLSIGRCRNLQ